MANESQTKSTQQKTAARARQVKRAVAEAEIALPSFSAEETPAPKADAFSKQVAAPAKARSASLPKAKSAGSRTVSTAAADSVRERLRQAREQKSQPKMSVPSRGKSKGKGSEDLLESIGKRFNGVFRKAAQRRGRSKSESDFPINRSFFGRLKRYGPAKVYRLKGYTTVGRVNRKRRTEQSRWRRNRIIFWGIFVIALIVVLIGLDPINRLRGFLHNIGY